jgi:hypothetical protein
MLNRLAPLPHRVRVGIEPLLHSVEHVLVLPPRNPSLPTRRAFRFARASPGMRLSNSAAAPSQLRLFSHAVVAIDGAKFKGVNSRDRNFTKGKLTRRVEQVEASIERYLHSLEAADLQEGEHAEAKASRMRNKIAAMKVKLAELKQLETAVLEAPDQQISITDPDARAMATSMRGAGVVGYNIQAAFDTEHHLIVAHDVTNIVTDRAAAFSHCAPGKRKRWPLIRSMSWQTAVTSAAMRSLPASPLAPRRTCPSLSHRTQRPPAVREG